MRITAKTSEESPEKAGYLSLLAIALGVVFWNVYLTLLGLLGILLYSKSYFKKPIEVLGLSYGNGVFGLDLRNGGDRRYHVKYEIRSVRAVPEIPADSFRQDGVDMMPAAAHAVRMEHQLLAEGEAPAGLCPSAFERLSCEGHLPVDFTGITPDQDLMVTIHYGLDRDNLAKKIEKRVKAEDEHPYLRAVARERLFHLKADNCSILNDVGSVGELANALRDAPGMALEFHTNGRNDFADWMGNVVGDRTLAEDVRTLDASNPAEFGERIIKMLNDRILVLRRDRFRGRHPFLNELEEGYSFVFKTSEHEVVGGANSLEGLVKVVGDVPGEAIEFHMSGRNDFGNWVGNAIGDRILERKLDGIGFTGVEETRARLVGVINGRISELRRI